MDELLDVVTNVSLQQMLDFTNTLLFRGPNQKWFSLHLLLQFCYLGIFFGAQVVKIFYEFTKSLTYFSIIAYICSFEFPLKFDGKYIFLKVSL